MDLNTYSYLPYQSGGRRSVASSSGAILGSPSYYAGARMMVRHPSNGSQASVGSAYAVSTASSSPGGHSPVSPGADITNSLSYMDFHGSSGQQEYQHQQQVGAMYQAAPTYYDYQSNYRSPVAPIQSTPASSCEDWCQYYDFIAEVEHGQAPYWRLKDGFSPNQNYPSVRPTITGSDAATDSTSPRPENGNLCLERGCNSKPFKRKADLERHYRQVHRDASQKKSYPCDYQRCARSNDYFYRLDHCRDHYREYHKEDICRRGGSSSSSSTTSSGSSSSSSRKKETPEWWADRNLAKKWWRCSKCLSRVYIEQDGFECRDCRIPCEAERRRHRGYE